MKRSALYAVLALCLAGCGAPVYSLLLRPNADPTQSVLRSVSSAAANTVGLEWDGDRAADEFRVYRSDTPDGEKTLLYSGLGNSYSDGDIPSSDNIPVFYFLEKRRGDAVFPQSAPEMGFKSKTVLDAFEPNDAVEEASPFHKVAESNLYLFKHGEYVRNDYDWYSASIGPHESAEVMFTDVSGSTLTVELLVEGRTPANLVRNSSFYLDNPTDSAKNVLFRISLSPSNLSGNGGMFYAYKLTLASIVMEN